MKSTKKIYNTPNLTNLGNVQQITRGPIKPSINDGMMGQGDNTQIGCQPPGHNGPDYQICDPNGSYGS